MFIGMVIWGVSLLGHAYIYLFNCSKLAIMKSLRDTYSTYILLFAFLHLLSWLIVLWNGYKFSRYSRFTVSSGQYTLYPVVYLYFKYTDSGDMLSKLLLGYVIAVDITLPIILLDVCVVFKNSLGCHCMCCGG